MGKRYFYPFQDCVYSLEIYKILDTNRTLWSILKSPKGGELEEIENSGLDGSSELGRVSLLPEEVYRWAINCLIAESK